MSLELLIYFEDVLKELNFVFFFGLSSFGLHTGLYHGWYRR